jgi:hypothetical protein
VFLCLAFPGGVSAQTGAAEARFAEGRAAFEARDFPRALRLYEECVALGMQGPAVHYNIGVAAYRASDLARAERAFREVAATPAMAALAHYNLGLVALKRGDSAAARGWFERTSRETSDATLTALAARRLAELPGASAAMPAVESPPPWSVYGRGGIGFDDNVGLRSESLDTPGSGEDDTFAELLVAGSYSFASSWRADAAAGTTRYSSVEDYDQTAMSLGVTRELSLGAWRLDLGARLSRMSLGGDVYERSTTGAARAARGFDGGGTLRADLRLSDVDGEGVYAGLSGTRTNLGVQFDWTWRSVGFVARSRAESNDTREEAFETEWVELDAEARWAATPRWDFAAGGAWRRTKHPTPLDGPAWVDRRVSLRLEATRELWRQAQLLVRYEREDNASPFAAYDYDRNWVAVSVEVWR